MLSNCDYSICLSLEFNILEVFIALLNSDDEEIIFITLNGLITYINIVTQKNHKTDVLYSKLVSSDITEVLNKLFAYQKMNKKVNDLIIEILSELEL